MSHFLIALVYYLILLIGIIIVRLYGSRSVYNATVNSKKNLSGYYAIVTGSNQGIGYEVAQYLVNHGAHVVLACRNDKRGKNAEKQINAQIISSAIYKGGKAEYIQCDLSNLESTKAFIANYLNKQYPLHLLINNAGLGNRKQFKLTSDGFEIVWQICYLAHFLITYRLLPLMIKSAVSNGKSFDVRIVNTSSMMHQHAFIDFDALNGDQQVRSSGINDGPYARAKLAQILHSTYLQRQVFNKYKVGKIKICSLNPGGVRTDIFRTNKWNILLKTILFVFYPIWYFGMRTVEQGSRTTIYCAVAPELKDREWGGCFIPGAYHENLRAVATRDRKQQSTDNDEMRKLYLYSLRVLKLKERTKDDYNSIVTK